MYPYEPLKGEMEYWGTHPLPLLLKTCSKNTSLGDRRENSSGSMRVTPGQCSVSLTYVTP